ncbi:glycosyltransferase [Buttiauxella gaviniae]|uniref:glycosyltransferase n=1 Tax=Buttiauxella gaviniae TaxID=82990 RepID=UPI0039B04685
MKNKRVLLVGDFSGVHYELRKQLGLMGYDVQLLSDGDVYKNFPADILFRQDIKNNRLAKVIRKITSSLGINGFFYFIRNVKMLLSLRNYDVVQLINPKPLQGFGLVLNFIFLRWIFKHNSNVYLCALGEDYYWVDACLKKAYKYSALDNLSKNTKDRYKYSLGFVSFPFKMLNDYCLLKCKKIIPGLYDYYLAYCWHDKCINVIPLPIGDDLLADESLCLDGNEKINIFHGWQKGKELKKGSFIFDNAIKKIILKYGDKIDYSIIQDRPYKEYVSLFKQSHIFIDQCYSYDKGMNALLGMAAGKVVFSGAEDITKDAYKLDETGSLPLINAVPDESVIFEQIESLVLDVNKINVMSKRAIQFTKDNHSVLNVTLQYLDVWNINEG